MGETPITRPFSLQWPLTEQQVEDLNSTLDDIYELLKQRKAAAAPDHQLLSEPHTDTTPADEVNGDLVVGQGGKFKRFPIGVNGDHLQVQGGAPVWSPDGSTLEDLNATEITSGTLDPARLADSGAAAGTYGDATHVSQVTVDVKGRVTAAANVAIAIPPSTHNLLSTTHPDTSAASPVLGDVIVAQNSGGIDAVADWLDGLPYDYLPNANNNGEEKYWMAGLPGAGLVSTGAVAWARKANGTAGYVLTAGATGPDWQPAAGSALGVSVYRSTDLIISDRTHTVIPLSTVITDDGAFWSAGSPSRLTVPVGQAGWYVVVGQIATLAATGRRMYTEIYVNGILRSRCGGDFVIVQASAVLKLAVGDYVELYGYTDQDVPYGYTETAVGGSTSTLISMVRI